MGLVLSEAWPGGRSETGQTRRSSRKERRREPSTIQGQERLREQRRGSAARGIQIHSQSVRPLGKTRGSGGKSPLLGTARSSDGEWFQEQKVGPEDKVSGN